MNPGKRRKMQKREFLMSKVLENRKKLSEPSVKEETLEVVTPAKEVVQEVVEVVEPVVETVQEVVPTEAKASKKKKSV